MIYPPPDKRLQPVSRRVPSNTSSAKTLTAFGEYISAVVRSVQQSRISGFITDLVNFQTRHTSSVHNIEAGIWLRDRFLSIGYSDVVLHDFTVSGVIRHNIVCTKAGKIDPAKLIVICAHYDSRMSSLNDATSAAPGADDNASGTAALLELATVLREIETDYSIRFIAFSGEEQGLVGSTAYANLAAASSMQIQLVINLDMIGHPLNPAVPEIIVERDLGNTTTSNDAASQAYATKMTQAAMDHTTLTTSFGPIYSSDYMPFEQHGYVCIGAYDGADSEPFYHSSTDTIDKVNMTYCTEVIKMVLATVLEVTGKRNGAALVFDPDPISSSGNVALSTASAGVDLQRVAVTLQEIGGADIFGNYNLSGPYVRVVDVEPPSIVPPRPTDAIFVFSRTETGFGDVMAYHHIDRCRRFINSLGFPADSPSPVNVDAHGIASAYDPLAQTILLAQANGAAPRDAEDAGVILHQYAHAIQTTQNPGFVNNNGLGSGFGDFLPAIYHDSKQTNPAATRGLTAPWSASGRRYDRAWLFDDATIVTEAAKGELWASTIFEIYRKVGGDSTRAGVRSLARDLVTTFHLHGNHLVAATNATTLEMAQQIEAADSNLAGWNGLANGLHTKVIYDTFRRRHMAGYSDLPVDVYVNDGRNGGYGSLSGNDLFNENLWDENYWDTQDIWVKTTAYASPAAQSAGGSADHIEPPVDSPAYLYTRVKNRGTNAAGSGPVTVRAFHCAPGIGLVWPDDWTEMDATQVTQPANVLPGTGNGQIVGPFVWTPDEVGHECVLVIIECANDRAVTETLASTAHVEHSNLVPFDNNLAQRNLAPTSAKGKMKRGFYVRNPETEVRIINLDFESRLPEGWSFHTNVVDPKGIRLGPLEKRWVEVIIDQNKGSEVTTFEKNYTLTVVGTIDDKVIGGMTFYVAPPSAFGIKPTSGRGTHEVDVHHNPNDLFCLNIPWKDCEMQGEMRLKINFRNRS